MTVRVFVSEASLPPHIESGYTPGSTTVGSLNLGWWIATYVYGQSLLMFSCVGILHPSAYLSSARRVINVRSVGMFAFGPS